MKSTNVSFFDFRGRVVLITGAATGIGRAVAVAFAEHGANLVIGDVNEDAAGETMSQVNRAGSDALFARTDVSDEADVKKLVSEAIRRFCRLDCAFNNAGIAAKNGQVHIVDAAATVQGMFPTDMVGKV